MYITETATAIKITLFNNNNNNNNNKKNSYHSQLKMFSFAI